MSAPTSAPLSESMLEWLVNYRPAEACALVATESERLGRPTDGEFAGLLWRVLSGGGTPATHARACYLAAGYEPFRGFPLTRRSS